MKILKGDQVLITAGKDKGQKGTVERIFPKSDRVRVAGVNLYKRARKAIPAGRQGFAGQPGGMIEFARPLNIGNIALLCPKCGKQTRVGYLEDRRGEKTRVCKKCKASLDKAGGKK